MPADRVTASKPITGESGGVLHSIIIHLQFTHTDIQTHTHTHTHTHTNAPNPPTTNHTEIHTHTHTHTRAMRVPDRTFSERVCVCVCEVRVAKRICREVWQARLTCSDIRRLSVSMCWCVFSPFSFSPPLHTFSTSS